jgi:NAD(P)-dependent dehydrogenase (short-subunit alcohol dehydrogenase family)
VIESDVAAMFEAAVEEFGRVDAVLNVAGIGVGGPIHKTTMEDYDKVMDVDVPASLLRLSTRPRPRATMPGTTSCVALKTGHG